jgi:hypothetical protein
MLRGLRRPRRNWRAGQQRLNLFEILWRRIEKTLCLGWAGADSINRAIVFTAELAGESRLHVSREETGQDRRLTLRGPDSCEALNHRLRPVVNTRVWIALASADTGYVDDPGIRR